MIDGDYILFTVSALFGLATQCSDLLEPEVIAHAKPDIKCIPELYAGPTRGSRRWTSFDIGSAGV